MNAKYTKYIFKSFFLVLILDTYYKWINPPHVMHNKHHKESQKSPTNQYNNSFS